MRVLSINQIAHVPVIKKNGLISDEWRIVLQQLFDSLASQLHPTNGVSLPQQTTDKISQIVLTKNLSRILYDSSLNRFVGVQNGAIKKFVVE